MDDIIEIDSDATEDEALYSTPTPTENLWNGVAIPSTTTISRVTHPMTIHQWADGEPDRVAEKLLCWYRANGRILPWRSRVAAQDTSSSSSALATHVYRVWVSEIMLQQTRVEAVIPYFHRWMSAFPSLAALAQASEDDVRQQWAGLGYYSRALNLLAGAQQLYREYGAGCPPPHAWESVRGVGPYTVGALQSIGYGLPRAAVDCNVLRVVSRMRGLCRVPILSCDDEAGCTATHTPLPLTIALATVLSTGVDASDATKRKATADKQDAKAVGASVGTVPGATLRDRAVEALTQHLYDATERHSAKVRSRLCQRAQSHAAGEGVDTDAEVVDVEAVGGKVEAEECGSALVAADTDHGATFPEESAGWRLLMENRGDNRGEDHSGRGGHQGEDSANTCETAEGDEAEREKVEAMEVEVVGEAAAPNIGEEAQGRGGDAHMRHASGETDGAAVVIHRTRARRGEGYWARASTQNPYRAQGLCAELTQALIELGAVVCGATAAKCGECPVREWCTARRWVERGVCVDEERVRVQEPAVGAANDSALHQTDPAEDAEVVMVDGAEDAGVRVNQPAPAGKRQRDRGSKASRVAADGICAVCAPQWSLSPHARSPHAAPAVIHAPADVLWFGREVKKGARVGECVAVTGCAGLVRVEGNEDDNNKGGKGKRGGEAAEVLRAAKKPRTRPEPPRSKTGEEQGELPAATDQACDDTSTGTSVGAGTSRGKVLNSKGLAAVESLQCGILRQRAQAGDLAVAAMHALPASKSAATGSTQSARGGAAAMLRFLGRPAEPTSAQEACVEQCVEALFVRRAKDGLLAQQWSLPYCERDLPGGVEDAQSCAADTAEARVKPILEELRGARDAATCGLAESCALAGGQSLCSDAVLLVMGGLGGCKAVACAHGVVAMGSTRAEVEAALGLLCAAPAADGARLPANDAGGSACAGGALGVYGVEVLEISDDDTNVSAGGDSTGDMAAGAPTTGEAFNAQASAATGAPVGKVWADVDVAWGVSANCVFPRVSQVDIGLRRPARAVLAPSGVAAGADCSAVWCGETHHVFSHRFHLIHVAALAAQPSSDIHAALPLPPATVVYVGADTQAVAAALRGLDTTATAHQSGIRAVACIRLDGTEIAAQVDSLLPMRLQTLSCATARVLCNSSLYNRCWAPVAGVRHAEGLALLGLPTASSKAVALVQKWIKKEQAQESKRHKKTK